MKEETIKYIEELMTKHYFRNPSAITSCIFMKGLEEIQMYAILRKKVIKEMDRMQKKMNLKFEMPKE